jgi:peptidoglycan/LPS O-acetylase OafA/YrhL
MRLYKLEALRGFAAVYVVLHHSLPHVYIVAGINFGNLFRFGQEAVILFFLLSGFVINYSFQVGCDKTFRTFFLKRFARIYIPLILIMLLGYLVESVRAGSLVDPEFKNLGLNLLMLQDVSSLKPNTIVEPYLHNSPLWSLSYEWWFYMLFYPVVTLVKTEKSQSNIVFCMAVISSLAYVAYPNFTTRLLMYMGIWWAGVYLSNVSIAGLQIGFATLKKPIFSLLAICVILYANYYFTQPLVESMSIGVHPFLEFRHMLFAFCVVVFAVVWSKIGWIGFDFVFKPFMFFAPMSYVIYISHYYLVTDARYLSFLRYNSLEWSVYFLNLLIFAYVVEVIAYPKSQRNFLKLTLAKI